MAVVRGSSPDPIECGCTITASAERVEKNWLRNVTGSWMDLAGWVRDLLN